jgi:hypothetical protein
VQSAAAGVRERSGRQRQSASTGAAKVRSSERRRRKARRPPECRQTPTFDPTFQIGHPSVTQNDVFSYTQTYKDVAPAGFRMRPCGVELGQRELRTHSLQALLGYLKSAKGKDGGHGRPPFGHRRRPGLSGRRRGRSRHLCGQAARSARLTNRAAKLGYGTSLQTTSIRRLRVPPSSHSAKIVPTKYSRQSSHLPT